MNITEPLIPYGITAVMIAAAMPAWPQNRLGAELIKLWGGTYSTNCGDPSAALAAELDRLWVAEWRQNR